MKNLKSVLLAALFVITGWSMGHAQNNSALPVSSIKQMADDRELTFKAEAINVRGGLGAPSSLFKNTLANGPDNHITLNGNYTLTLKPESISSTLPFSDDQFYNRTPGDNYVNPVLSPVSSKFSAIKYKYTVKQHKQGGIEILITPETNIQMHSFLLQVEPNGKATLTVTDGRNNTFSYAGTVAAQG